VIVAGLIGLDLNQSETKPLKSQSDGESKVWAILLAAGKSRRMGEFKPLLPFGEQTVIESCIDYLQRGGVDKIVVVVGHRATDVRQQLSGRGVLFGLNTDPDSEMATSIARGIECVASGTGAVLIALTDQPAIPAEVVRALMDQWRKGSRIIKPEIGGRGGHPVLVDLAYKDELLHLNPDSGLKGFFDRHKDEVCRLPLESVFIARDMDTWDDYLSLHQEVFGTDPRTERRFDSPTK